MGVGSGGQRSPWIFILDTDKVEGGLMLLFFGLVFSVGHPPGIFSADVLVYTISLSLRIPHGSEIFAYADFKFYLKQVGIKINSHYRN